MNCIICQKLTNVICCISCQQKHLLDSNGYELKPVCKIDIFGHKTWTIHGKRHRVNGPAVEYASGNKEWWLYGKRHREGGPAVEHRDGYKEWYFDGLPHREDGPAVEYPNGYEEYWIHGQMCDANDIRALMKGDDLCELL